MYSSGYSQVSKYSPQAQKKMQYRSKGKSCGYYMRIVFFFSSLIQSLIIVSLVLFLIYGKKQDSPSTSRIQDLEESFSRLSIENVALRQQRKNLTTLLNSTLIEKARNDWDLAKLRYFSNISAVLIQDMDKRLQQCNGELFFCKSTNRLPGQCPQLQTHGCNCGLLVEQMKARLELVESNFTQTTQRMRMEMDQVAKDRDNLNLEVIRLRRDKSTHEKEVEFYRQKCKDDFSHSLSGVSNVTKAFLHKVDSLFPTHIAFQLTCPKQREHLEQIRTNCTSLSREVEDKFQQYLNSVGEQVSRIQSENSRLKAENWRLSEDYRWCSQNRTSLIQQNKQNLDKLQRKHDEDKERLLMDKMRLNGQIEVLQNNVRYKSKEVEHIAEQLKFLNMSCMATMGFGGLPGGLPPRPGTSQNGFGGGSSFSGVGQIGRSGPGSSGSPYNKPVSTGTGSSSSNPWSTGSSSSTGSAYNKPASTGTGSSSSNPWSTGSSSANKPASTGTGSSSSNPWSTGSSSSNKPASTGTGSSSSNPWSTGSSSSTGSASNKPASTGTGSSSTSLWSAGSSSSNKPASTGTGSSSTSLWSTGSSSSNKPASTGTGSSSTSLWSTGSSSSNKPASTGTGSSSTSLWSTGSSSSNKPASTGTGSSSYGSNPSLSSSGTGSNKPALTGRGSSTTGSSYGSAASSSSGTSSNKPTTNVRSSSSLGSSSTSSSGSTGSTSKSGSSSSGLSWLGLGLGNSNSGQSKPGSGTGKGPSSGTSYGGSSTGAGRTSGLGGGSVSVAQHLQDLQRLINSAGPEEKQDLSRMLG